MRSKLLGSVAVLALLGAVDGASAQPVNRVADGWTGLYVGANVGYSWGRSSDFANFVSPAGPTLATASAKFDMNGVIGGGQTGYNVQAGNWLWGWEMDFQGTDQKGDANTRFICPAVVCQAGNPGTTFGTGAAAPLAVVATTFNQKLDWFGTLRGRVGALVAPNVLLYGTAGLAFGRVETSGTITGQNGGGTPTGTAFASHSTRPGWTAGGGAEWRFLDHWSCKIEYLYVDLMNDKIFAAGPVNFIPVNLVVNSHVTDNILRVGANYRF
jgi:outer membrane immunogenic protein